MGSIFRNLLGGISNRRRKKQTASKLKRVERQQKKIKTGFKNRIMKIMEKASKHFFTIQKMCQMLNVQGADCLNVALDVGELACKYKLVWRNRRGDFGLFSHWIPIEEISKRVLAELSTGAVCTYLALSVCAAGCYQVGTFEFSLVKLMNDFVNLGVVTQGRNVGGGRVFRFTPNQFFEYKIRDVRS